MDRVGCLDRNHCYETVAGLIWMNCKAFLYQTQSQISLIVAIQFWLGNERSWIWWWNNAINM